MNDFAPHQAVVDAWLAGAGKRLDVEALLQLFERATAAVWSKTVTTLGDVTLTAVAERVLYDVAELYPTFPPLRVEHGKGIIQGAHDSAVRANTNRTQTRAAIRFILAEFLGVLGTMTGELLTPELHEALAQVAVSDETDPSEKGGSRS